MAPRPQRSNFGALQHANNGNATPRGHELQNIDTLKQQQTMMDQPTQRPLKATVHSHIVFVEDDGVVLATYGLALVVRGQGIRLTELPANTRVVVLSGYGAGITVAAIHACVSKHIEVLITSPRYGVMAMFVPSPIINANRAGLAIRRKQFEAVCDPVRSLKVARAIICEKIKAERHGRTAERVFLTELRKAKTTDDVRHVEAKAAQVWWQQWAEFRMSFKGAAAPGEWGLWPGRYISDGGRAGWENWRLNSQRETRSIRYKHYRITRLE
jgi:hypothetical protein